MANLLFFTLALLSCVSISLAETDVKVTLCFSGDSLVETKGKGLVKISELNLNDEIKTLDESSGKPVFSKFVDYLHYDRTIETSFIQFFLGKDEESSSPLEVTDYHLVKRVKPSSASNFLRWNRIGSSHPLERFDLAKEDFEFVFAKELRPNDLVILASSTSSSNVQDDYVYLNVIMGTNRVQKHGAYAPLTETGTLFVNNVLVSSFANVISQSVAQLAFKPYLYWLKCTGSSEYSTTSNMKRNEDETYEQRKHFDIIFLQKDSKRPVEIYMNSYTNFIFTFLRYSPLSFLIEV